MALISDEYQKNKLNKYNINIRSKYFAHNKIYEKNTDDSINEDINHGILIEKEYYINNNLIHKENDFDSRIEYTYIYNENEDIDYQCINCGMQAKIKDFIDGCPYCKTSYNIDYTDKDLGSKYHYDRVLRSNLYKVVVGVVDLIISIILCYFFIKHTSRTFNEIDILKIFIYGLILSIILYYFFYILDAYIVLGPIKKYKDMQNKKQIYFWNKTNIDKKVFFNNLNYEIRKHYYLQDDIIDFDMLDYINFSTFSKQNKEYIKVLADVRIVYYKDGKIASKVRREEYTLRRNNNDVLQLKDGVNVIKCHNCGSSISAVEGTCSYCHSEIKYLQQWILEE